MAQVNFRNGLQWAIAALCATAPVSVLAQSASSSDFTFYGQLNFGVFAVDDGVNSDTYLADNDNSNSRIGLIYDVGLANGGRFKFHFESALGFPGSASLTPTMNDFDLSWRRTELRKFEVVYTTPTIGAFSFGQGSTATDGIAEQDFSGTSVVMYAGLADLGSSIIFNSMAGMPTGVSVGSVFSDLDGARRFRVRYDSPSFSGFNVSVSAGEEVLRRGDDRSYYDLGLRYARDYGDIKVAGGIGYSWIDSDEEILSGSVAALHKPTGLNAAFSAGRQQNGDDDYTYLKLGVIRDLTSLGSTAFSIDYYNGNDFAVTGSDSSSVGLGVVQKVDQYNTEIYAGYRRYSYDDPGVTARDVDVAVVGARWKF